MDPRESFIQRVDVLETRVRSHAGFIFLCGGAADYSSSSVLSVRHRILSEISNGRNSDLAKRVKLAEEIKDWYRGAKYSDLVTFETHLAAIASLIVLVVESPGAIAELGVFTVVPEISRKLILVVEETHYSSDSYIKLGPIAKYEEENRIAALVHPWMRTGGGGFGVFDPALVEDDVPGIVSEIRKRSIPSSAEAIFSASDPQHLMLLAMELCSLFGALTEREVVKYLQHFAASIDPGRVSQYLWLLARCGLLIEKARGHGRYFSVPDDFKTSIVFGFSDGKGVNRERLAADVVGYYKEENPTRFAVLRGSSPRDGVVP